MRYVNTKKLFTIILILFFSLVFFSSDTNQISSIYSKTQHSNRKINEIMVKERMNEISDFDDRSNSTLSNYPSQHNVIEINGIPSVDSPNDVYYTEGEVNNFITWTISGSGNSRNYTIYKDALIIDQGSWLQGGEQITMNVDRLSSNSYNYTILVSNNSGTATDTVYVNVEALSMTFIKLPTNLTISLGSLGNYLEWVVSDNDPDSFSIYRDGIELFGGGWQSNIPIKINVDYLEIGTYNYTIELWDEMSNTILHTVFVVVSDSPVFIQPESTVVFANDTQTNFLTWTASDSNPDKYIAFENNTLLQSGTWNSSIPITFSIGKLKIGIYNYSIIVNDTDGQFSYTNTTVFVGDRPQWIIKQSSVTFYESESNNKLSWSAQDMLPATYEFYKNGNLLKTGLWYSESIIELRLDSFNIGIYNITIFIFDTYGISNNDSVIFYILDKLSPVITSKMDDFSAQIDVEGLEIKWTATDKHPNNYTILVNNALKSAGFWVNNETISYSLNQIELVVYNITLSLYDSSNNKQIDFVIVEINPIFSKKPNINPETFVYEGDKETVIGKWETLSNGAGISFSNISLSLYNNVTLISKQVFFTDSSGLYDFELNYENLNEGLYRWEINFNKQFYQNWTLTFDITVAWYTYQLTIETDQELIQGNPFTISVYITKMTDTSSLQLNKLQMRSNILANVKIELILTITDMDETYILINRSSFTNDSGVSEFTIEASITSIIRSIDVIEANIGMNLYIYSSPATLDEDYIPQVQPNSIINWWKINIEIDVGFALMALLGLFFILVFFTIDPVTNLIIRVRYHERAALYKEYRRIYGIFIFNKNGLLFYENQFNTLYEVDSLLFASFTSAVISFLDELSKDELTGFQEFRKEEFVITAHKSTLSTIAVLSKSFTSNLLKEKLKRSHITIEKQFGEALNFEISFMGPELTKKVSEILIHEGIPILLIQGVTLKNEVLTDIISNRKLPRLYSSRANLFKQLTSSNDIEIVVTLDSLATMIEKLGISEEIAVSLISFLVDLEAFSELKISIST